MKPPELQASTVGPGASWLALTSGCATLALQIEGRGNGIKTNAVNLVEVSKALERPTECALICIHAYLQQSSTLSYPIARVVGERRKCENVGGTLKPAVRFADVLKFFGCELGAQTKFSGDSGTCIVNGGQPLPRPCSSALNLGPSRDCTH